MGRRFFTLDVFTQTALCGNPLAVVLDSDGLDDDAMASITREFNLSETVFVFPPKEVEKGASIRIFTPAHELPFAGHPTVGTAILLNHLNHLDCQDEFVLEEKVGPVPCVVSSTTDGIRARFGLPKTSRQLDQPIDQSRFAQALGLEASDIDEAVGGVSVWDGGVPFTLVPVKDINAMRALTVDAGRLGAIEPVVGGLSANPYVFCRGGEAEDTDFHARMFAPNFGIAEDPATGSAVAAFSGLIAQMTMAADQHREFKIEQGYEMGRPSEIYLSLETGSDGRVVNAAISGSAVIVSEGILHI